MVATITGCRAPASARLAPEPSSRRCAASGISSISMRM
jgi:hypothetical protein